MAEWRKIFEAEYLFEPTMAYVAYRAKLEERYQANALIQRGLHTKGRIGPEKRPLQGRVQSFV
jgi:hypothetical protein